MVEYERDTDHRRRMADRGADPAGERSDRRVRGRKEGRCRSRRLDRARTATGEERAGASLLGRFRGRDAHHEIGIDDGAVNRDRLPAVYLEDAQVSARRIVDDDRAPESACPEWAEDALEVTAPRTPTEAACDQDRVLLRRHAEANELVHHRRNCLLPRVVRYVGERERARLDDDRRPAPGRRESGERCSREWVAERFTDSRLDIAQRFERAGREQ